MHSIKLKGKWEFPHDSVRSPKEPLSSETSIIVGNYTYYNNKKTPTI